MKCKTCNREYTYDRNAGHTRKECNTCIGNRKRYKRKLKCIDYKGSNCLICNYNECDKALTFHHVQPNLKSFSISEARDLAWDKVKAELDKCVLLCQNCHHAVHAAPEYMEKSIEATLMHMEYLRKIDGIPINIRLLGASVSDLYTAKLFVDVTGEPIGIEL